MLYKRYGVPTCIITGYLLYNHGILYNGYKQTQGTIDNMSNAFQEIVTVPMGNTIHEALVIDGYMYLYSRVYGMHIQYTCTYQPPTGVPCGPPRDLGRNPGIKGSSLKSKYLR